MTDVLMLAVVVGFFLVCVAYVSLCDRIVGDDVEADESGADDGTTAGGTDDAMEVAA